eukprot:m.88269 g.88269  ORF g.88269 m.88269 type:complete len:494 (+) comp13156_c0_seq1:233-1714(+)
MEAAELPLATKCIATAIQIFTGVCSEVYLFCRYVLFGWRLPERASPLLLLRWHWNHGYFQGHRLSAKMLESSKDGIVSVNIPTRGLHVFISDVSMIEMIHTNKKLFPTRGHSGFQAWVPDGLLGLETGPRWAHHRRLVSSCLSTQRLQQYSDNIVKHGTELLEIFDDLAEKKKKVDISAYMARCTLDIIGSVAFGMELTNLKEGSTEWSRTSEVILKESSLQTMQPNFLKWFPFGRQKKFQEALAFAKSRARQQLPENADIPSNSILGLLRAARDVDGQLTDDEVIQETLTIGGAGHETTSNTLCWCLMLLAENPHCQDKVFDEVTNIMTGDVATFDEVRQMSYCLSVLYETLRLKPTVPIYKRECAETCTIGGYDIPKGSQVIISQMSLNYNPKYFPEPNVFKPERFAGKGTPATTLPVGCPNGPSYAFIPFGAGPRTCVGQRFAILEATQLLSGIIKRYRVTLPTNATPVLEHVSITLRPRGLYLLLEKRN